VIEHFGADRKAADHWSGSQEKMVSVAGVHWECYISGLLRKVWEDAGPWAVAPVTAVAPSGYTDTFNGEPSLELHQDKVYF